MRRGYTETDPREDMSGLDVARKALIMCENDEFCIQNEEFCIRITQKREILYPKNEEFCIQNDDFVSARMQVSRNDDFCIKNEKLCKIEKYCIKCDDFCRDGTSKWRTSSMNL